MLHLRSTTLISAQRRVWGSKRVFCIHLSSTGRRSFNSDSPTPTSERLKVLFMGRDEFSCSVLQELYKASDVWDELVIVTSQDQRTGRRGSELTVSPLKVLAQTMPGTRLEYIPHTKPEFRKWELPSPFSLNEHASDALPPSRHVVVTASFGRILTRTHLSNFLPARRLNVHPSLLPQYRGPAPIQHSLINGDAETGVCLLEMLPLMSKKAQEESGVAKPSAIDAGNIWASTKVIQPPTADFARMRDTLAVEGGKLLVETLRKMRDGVTTAPVPQVAEGSPVEMRPAPMISLEDAVVDPISMTSDEIHRRHRAIGHQRPLHTVHHQGTHQRPIQLHDVHTVPNHKDLETKLDQLLPSTPGSALCLSSSLDTSGGGDKADKKRIFMRCKDGSVLAISKVKPEGKPVISAVAFWNGIKTKESDGSIRLGV